MEASTSCCSCTFHTSTTTNCCSSIGVSWGFHSKQAVSFPQSLQMNPFPSQLNSLLSSLVSLYTLILFLSPKLLFSPTLLSVSLLLLSLLRLGASQHAARIHRHDPELLPGPALDPGPVSSRAGSFVEWDVGAPLEVIHEGEEDGEAASNNAFSVSAQPDILGNRPFGGSSLQRYPSLSRYYPETDSESESDSDSGSSMDGEFPERVSFRWAGEEIDGEKYGLIEIQLDADCGKRKVLEESDFQIEEDNFIEIDISPASAGGER